jgi:rhodanese-related sulfurtransferase
MTIPEIHRDEVAEHIRRDDATLVEALPEHVYAEGHLPGAINIRPRRVDELAPTLLPDPDARIIVYCGSATCDASLRVAQHLHNLGYHNVHRYTAGKQDWTTAGLPTNSQPPKPGDCSQTGVAAATPG